MFYPQNESNSEVKHDQFVQSNLAYWSAPPRPMAVQNPQAWEAEPPIRVKAGPWVWFLLSIVIALSVFLSVLI
jgi:hypothetical protein